MSEQQKPPLWRVMHRAYDESAPPGDAEWTNSCGYAAEIRALTGWVEAQQLEDYGVVLPGVASVLAQLRAEADRADAGE